MRTAYLYSPVFLEHEEEGHPESPERLRQILHVLQTTGVLPRLTALEPVAATEVQIAAVHTEQHIERVKQLVARGGGHFDPDTYANARSLDAAKLALDYGIKDPKSRAGFLIAEPGANLTADQAAQKVLAAFLPRAFRRPATDPELPERMAGPPFGEALG